jgi:hypothetical protein
MARRRTHKRRVGDGVAVAVAAAMGHRRDVFSKSWGRTDRRLGVVQSVKWSRRYVRLGLVVCVPP